MAFQNALKQDNTLLEAAFGLAELEFDKQSLLSLLKGAPSWVVSLAEARCLERAFLFIEARTIYQTLESRYAAPLAALHGTARCEVQIGDIEAAESAYMKVMVEDPLVVDHMDSLAYLLKERAKVQTLNRLATGLLTNAPRRPETWLALALTFRTNRN